MEETEVKAMRCELLVIGGSAGSLETLLRVLPHLKKQIPFSIVIVLHRKKTPESTLAELFATRTHLPVKEIEDKDALKPGVIYIAPADYHLLFEKNKLLSLDYSEKINYSRPSIDVTFESAAEIYGAALTGLLLSGANADGSTGLRIIKQKGGQVAVQDPKTADSPFMPEHAIRLAQVELILDVFKIIEFINAL